MKFMTNLLLSARRSMATCRYFRRGIITRGLSTFPSSAYPFPQIVTNAGSKLKNTFGLFEYPKHKLYGSGYALYAACADNVKCEEFIINYNLEDTFFTWFHITELHVWMCIARAMEEGKEGRFVKEKMVEAMWIDIDTRISRMIRLPASKRKAEMKELNEQFRYTLFLYDEGILSDDKVLAGALWQRLFDQRNSDIPKLESLVQYTRSNAAHLHTLDREHILTKGTVQWLPVTPLSGL